VVCPEIGRKEEEEDNDDDFPEALPHFYQTILRGIP
jgi:hypothetical protein